MKSMIGVLALLIGLSAGTTQAQVKLDGFKFGTAIENNEVTGEGTTFPANGGKVYCWIKVVGGEGQTLTMKWSYNGTAMDEIPLEIKSWSMRTYAYKEIYRAGTWKVEVADAAGKVLQAGEFTTTQ